MFDIWCSCFHFLRQPPAIIARQVSNILNFALLVLKLMSCQGLFNNIFLFTYLEAHKFIQWNWEIAHDQFSLLPPPSISGLQLISLSFRSFRPDFVLVRQHPCDAGENWRNVILGLMYGGVHSVNSLHAIYNFLDRPWVVSPPADANCWRPEVDIFITRMPTVCANHRKLCP